VGCMGAPTGPGRNSAASHERRRHTRYPASKLGCRFEWLEWAGGEVAQPEAINLSSGGVCLRTARSTAVGEALWLKVVLPDPMGSAELRCIVRWLRPAEEGTGWIVGAEIIESTKGWFGPEEDCPHETTL